MSEAHEREIVEYVDLNGRAPFRQWLETLRDLRAKARIDARLLRVRLGNLGDAKSVGEGVHELRVDYGPGYRVYFGLDGPRIVILLLGGEKTGQKADIKRAKGYWAIYRAR